MGKGLLKWLASLGTGLLSTVLLYLQANVGDPTQGIEGEDAIVSFVAISLITKLVTWATSKAGPPKTDTADTYPR